MRLPSDAASWPVRTESSVTPLPEPQTLQILRYLEFKLQMFKETWSVSGVHKLSKNLGDTLKFWCPEGWHAASSILRTYKILGATVRNLVARATRPMGFAHPWPVSLRVCGAVLFNMVGLNFVSRLYMWARLDMLQSCVFLCELWASC
jgi:hypothetical protein